MPKDVLILYGTTEGQTRKIAEFVADRLDSRGLQPAMLDAATADPDPAGFSAALIAASLHAGHYQASVVDYVRRRHAALNAMPTAFLSVSLAAASHDQDDIDGLARCVAEFEHRTQWRPGQVHHVAGAFRFSQYDFLKRWAMKYIAYRKGQPTDASRDYELTDWSSVEGFVERFAEKLKTSAP